MKIWKKCFCLEFLLNSHINVQCVFVEQSTEILENTQALVKESVTEITEIHETSVQDFDVTRGDFEPTIPSTFCGQ